MTLPHFPRRPPFSVPAAALVCLALAVAAVGAGGWLSSPAPGAPAAASTPATAPGGAEEGVEVEVLTLRPRGFEPAEVKRPAGRFLLAVSSQTGGEGVSLALARVQGQRLREMRMGRGRVRSVNEFDLPPGEYLLTAEGHPEWSCRLTLTPR